MKIVFNLEKYSATITEDNWNCNHIPQKGDKVNLYWFVEFLNDRNVTEATDIIQKMNKDSKSPILCIKDFIGNRLFTVEEVIWNRDYNGVYCQVNIIL